MDKAIEIINEVSTYNPEINRFDIEVDRIIIVFEEVYRLEIGLQRPTVWLMERIDGTWEEVYAA